jgi:hypothetical protein
MKNKEVLTKAEDPAGVMNDARQMVSQLQEQAKNGQIDGAMLDQLAAILDVTVDTAEDAQAEGKEAMDSVSKTEDPTNPPPAEEPTSSEVEDEPESPEAPSEEAESGDEEESTVEPEEESTMEPKTEKVAQPLSTKPPKVNAIFDKVDDYQSKLPEFIKALTAGSIKRAQAIAGKDGTAFDTMFKMAQIAILNEGGWRTDNLEKLSGMAQVGSGQLAKGITSTSVPGVYLIKLAKLMLPLYAGLTNRIPAQSPTGMSSNQATWKAQLGYGSLNTSSFFRIAEAAIGVNAPTNFLTFNATFNDISVQDNVTLKALAASQGYADPMQISVIKSMSALLMGQEKIILGSNVAAITAPTSLTVTSGSTGGTFGNSGSAGTFYLRVTALTYEGWLAASVGGSAAIGESTATTSGSVVTSTSTTNSFTATWPAVKNAVAYNVYVTAVDAAGSTATYNKTVVINKAVLTDAGASTATPPSSDTTVNALGIEGLIGQCELSTIYGNAIPGKVAMVDNAGAGMTVGNGGITQFDQILASQWSNWQIAPSLMVMSPNMNAALVGKLLGTGGAGGFYRLDVTQERNTVNGGMMVTGYVNKFSPFADGTPKMIEIIPHPYMPDGTVLFMCETIPYPMGNESRGFVRDVLMPYTYFPLPSQSAGVNQISYNYAITTSEVLEGFNPSPQCALVGVDYTL